MEEVLTHQSSLDRVNERAQALLQTNADAKTSHAITQLTTRYHSVISMSKVCYFEIILVSSFDFVKQRTINDIKFQHH